LANALYFLSELQEKRGELTAASDSINRAVALAEELKDPKLLLRTYMDRGNIYVTFSYQCDYKAAFKVCYGYLDLAKADYERAIKISQGLGYQGLVNFAQLLERVEARRKLVKLREESIKRNAELPVFQPRTAKDVLVHERFVLGNPKIPPELAQLYRETRAKAEATGQRPSLDARHVAIEGDLLHFEGKTNEALPAYLKAVDLLEQNRGRLQEEEARSAYMEDKIDIYYKPIPILLDQRHYAEAFDLLERSRSRAMADMLATRDLELSSSQGRELYAQYRDLKAEIAQLKKNPFPPPEPIRLSGFCPGPQPGKPDCRKGKEASRPGGKDRPRGATAQRFAGGQAGILERIAGIHAGGRL
jgi:tetratricopeptide (TPR) repeat protein